MSYLLHQVQPRSDEYYFAREGTDASFEDITCNTITVNGAPGTSVSVNGGDVDLSGGDLIMTGGRMVASTEPLLPGMSATPTYRINCNGYMLINNGHDSAARLYMGPSPSGGNNDYCSMISATNTFSTNYGSDLGFWTHDVVSNTGEPTLRMTIDNAGAVNVVSGNLTLNGVPAQTAQTALVANVQQQPINISAGVNTTNMGAPITVPRTGLYILTGAFTYDGAAPDGITFGSADFLAVRLDAGLSGTSHGVNVNLRNCLGNNDGVSSATLVVPLVAGVSYQPMAIMYNISGVSTITGSPVYGAAFALTALC